MCKLPFRKSCKLWDQSTEALAGKVPEEVRAGQMSPFWAVRDVEGTRRKTLRAIHSSLTSLQRVQPAFVPTANKLWTNHLLVWNRSRDVSSVELCWENQYGLDACSEWYPADPVRPPQISAFRNMCASCCEISHEDAL